MKGLHGEVPGCQPGRFSRLPRTPPGALGNLGRASIHLSPAETLCAPFAGCRSPSLLCLGPSHCHTRRGRGGVGMEGRGCKAVDVIWILGTNTPNSYLEGSLTLNRAHLRSLQLRGILPDSPFSSPSGRVPHDSTHLRRRPGLGIRGQECEEREQQGAGQQLGEVHGAGGVQGRKWERAGVGGRGYGAGASPGAVGGRWLGAL